MPSRTLAAPVVCKDLANVMAHHLKYSLAKDAREATKDKRCRHGLGLDGNARMNIPGRESGDWRWRFQSQYSSYEF